MATRIWSNQGLTEKTPQHWNMTREDLLPNKESSKSLYFYSNYSYYSFKKQINEQTTIFKPFCEEERGGVNSR